MSYIPNAALPDKSSFTEGTTEHTPIGGEYNDTATAPSSGQSAASRITPNRALHTNLRNQSGTEIATSTNPVRVDPTGTTTQPVSGTVTVNAGTGTFGTSDSNAASQGSTTSGQKGFLEFGAVTTSAPAYTTTQSAPLSLTTAGALRTDSSGVTQPCSLLSVPTHAVTQSGAWNIAPSTSGGWSVFSQTALSTTVATVKASAGNLGGYAIYNPNSSVAYVQVFDASTVTLGSTAPTYVIPVPATSSTNLEISLGLTHATAIKVAATTTATGSTAPTTALVGYFLYK